MDITALDLAREIYREAPSTTIDYNRLPDGVVELVDGDRRILISDDINEDGTIGGLAWVEEWAEPSAPDGWEVVNEGGCNLDDVDQARAALRSIARTPVRLHRGPEGDLEVRVGTDATSEQVGTIYYDDQDPTNPGLVVRVDGMDDVADDADAAIEALHRVRYCLIDGEDDARLDIEWVMADEH